VEQGKPVAEVAQNRRGKFREEFWNVPNMLTMLRIVVIPLLCYLLAVGTPKACMWAAAIFGFAAITDFFDGYLARLQGLESVTGKFLDPLADKLIVMAALVVLVDLDRVPAWLVVIVLARELFINGLRTLASSEGIVMGAGLAGKYKTAFQLTGLSAILVHYQYSINFVFFESMVSFRLIGLYLFGASVFFSVSSAITYTYAFYKQLGSAPQEST